MKEIIPMVRGSMHIPKNQDNIACHFYNTVNLLFWVLWTCLATPVKNDSITYGKL